MLGRIVLLASLFVAVSNVDAQSPNKADLILTLDSAIKYLQVSDYEAAAKHFVMPPNASPSDLKSLIERKEISASGIRVLEKEAQFGSAAERFGEKRATYFASRSNVDVDITFGFNHSQGDVAAEVIAVWDSGSFKLIRLDDVGKLTSGKQASAPSIADLEANVKSDPTNPNFRATLAMNLYQQGRYLESWRQSMVARKMAPQHTGISKGVDALINKFSTLGMFAVGVARKELQEKLGEPQQKVTLNQGRDRWVYGHWAIDFKQDRIHELVNLRGASEELFLPKETISIDLDGRSWLTGFRRKMGNRSSAFLYVNGESMRRWNEQLVIDRILNSAALGQPVEIANRQIADEKKLNGNAFGKVLASDDRTVIFALTKPAEPAEATQHQLVRIFWGQKDLHRVTYTVKSASPPSQETQMKWFNLFRKAELTPVGVAKDSTTESK
ncbi:MAG: hypothetical protein AAGA30_05270 [Planctomycetota bacterium]